MEPIIFVLVPAAFFACSTNNEIIIEIIDRIISCYYNNPRAHVGIATGCLLFGDVIQNRIENKNLGNTKLLDHFEFKEGPEQLNWIEAKVLKEKLLVVHKLGDNQIRYKSFQNRMDMHEAKTGGYQRKK